MNIIKQHKLKIFIATIVVFLIIILSVGLSFNRAPMEYYSSSDIGVCGDMKLSYENGENLLDYINVKNVLSYEVSGYDTYEVNFYKEYSNGYKGNGLSSKNMPLIEQTKDIGNAIKIDIYISSMLKDDKCLDKVNINISNENNKVEIMSSYNDIAFAVDYYIEFDIKELGFQALLVITVGEGVTYTVPFWENITVIV